MSFELTRRQLLLGIAAGGVLSQLRPLPGSEKIRVASRESVLNPKQLVWTGRPEGKVVYTDDCLRKTLEDLDGLPVVSQFPDSFHEDMPIENVVGRVLNPEWREDGIYADVVLVPGVERPKELRWAGSIDGVVADGDGARITSMYKIHFFAPHQVQ